MGKTILSFEFNEDGTVKSAKAKKKYHDKYFTQEDKVEILESAKEQLRVYNCSFKF